MKKIIYILLCLYGSTYSMQRSNMPRAKNQYSTMPSHKLDSEISRLESRIKAYKQQYDPKGTVPVFTKYNNPRDLYQASKLRQGKSINPVDKYFLEKQNVIGQEKALDAALFQDTGNKNAFSNYYKSTAPLETKLQSLKDARYMQQIQNYLPGT